MGTSPTVAYVWALAICLVLFLINALIASIIPNKPGGEDIGKRKVWFWIIFVVAVVGAFVANYFVASGINIPSKHSAYINASAIATGVAALVYILLGLGLSKGMPRSKFGSWF